MIFKLGLKEFERSIYTNFLVILLLSTVFAVTISLVSGVVSRYSYYKPYKDIFNKDGVFCIVPYVVIPYDYAGKGETYEQAFNGFFKGTDEIIYNMRADFKIEKASQQVLIYDKKSLEYEPQLSEGIWLNKAEMTDDIVPIIVSQNKNYKLGDVFTMSYDYNFSPYVEGQEVTYDTAEQKFKVVGILAENSIIPDNSAFGETRINFKENGAKSLYSTYNSKFYDDIYMFSTKEFMEKSSFTANNAIKLVGGNVYLVYSKNITDEEKQSNIENLIEMGGIAYYKNSEIRSAAKEVINSQVYDLLPIVAMAFLMTLIANISATAISVKKQFRNFAVYYICGLKWRQCAFISLVNSLITVVMSVAFSSLIVVLINHFGLLKSTVIDLGFWQIIACLALGILNSLLAFIMPIILIKNTPPRQVLKTE
jgi:hypothetical protein